MADNRKLLVFIQYSRVDELDARELYEKLKSENWVDPWIDKENLHPGRDWQVNIDQAINSADVIISLNSRYSLDIVGYSQIELKRAVEAAEKRPPGDVFLIPLRLDNCNLNHTPLGQYQWVDFFGFEKEAAYTKLQLSLKQSLEKTIRREENLNSVISGIKAGSSSTVSRHVEPVSYRTAKESPIAGNDEVIDTKLTDEELGRGFRLLAEGVGIGWKWVSTFFNQADAPAAIGSARITTPMKQTVQTSRPHVLKGQIIDDTSKPMAKQATVEKPRSVSGKVRTIFRLALWAITVLIVAVFVEFIFNSYGMDGVVFDKRYWVPLAYGGFSLGILKGLQAIFIKRFFKVKDANSIWWSVCFYACYLMTISGEDALQILAGALFAIVLLVLLFSGLINCGCAWWPLTTLALIAVATYFLPFKFSSPFVMIVLNEIYFGISGLYLGVER